MSEGVVEGQEASAGALLRQAREQAGMHVDTLAANLKVPVRKLEALEQDRYDLLPDAVFVRALASSVCRTLKIDPRPVLQRLPQTAQPRLVHDNDGINAPFRSASEPKPGKLEMISRPVALTVVALLLAAVVLVFLPVGKLDDVLGPGRATPPAAPGAATSDPVMPPGTPSVTAAPAEPRGDAAPGASPAPLTASTSLSQPPRSQPMAAATVPPAPVPAAPAPVALTPAAEAAAAPASAATSGEPIRATGIVTFRAKGSSWVQVTDANGTPVLRKLLAAGESAGASGALPLAVTIGSVEQTEVQVRGKPFNLGPVSRDNVARFEVK